MKRALIGRFHSDDYATMGAMCDADSLKELCATLELPWRDNAHGESCIPAGTYVCRLRSSEKHHADVFEVTGVPHRSDIEIHSANWPSQLLGCIATGVKHGVVEGKRGVLQSRDALEKFMAWAGREDFELTITDPTPEPGA